jgi:cell division protein FtsB
VHSDGDGVDLRDFSDALHAASTLHNTLRDLYAQAQDQTNIIANLEDENARLKARIADLERAAAAPK